MGLDERTIGSSESRVNAHGQKLSDHPGDNLVEPDDSPDLLEALEEAGVHFALNTKDGLAILVLPAIVHLFQEFRRHPAIILLLSSHGNMKAAARFALTQNGIPKTMVEMGTQMVRDGRGMSVNYGPYVQAVCDAVAAHYKLVVADYGHVGPRRDEGDGHLQAS